MTGKWSDVPHDLLSLIANGLGLIDFLSFRGVCRDWYVASLKISPQDKSLRCDPWLLMYDGEEGSQCSLLTDHDKLHTIRIPELDGATCLGSYEGWLLIFRHGSLFLFCPFSKAKIELPNCPFTQVTGHLAAFSTVPTSEDCIIGVVNRNSKRELELFILCRGQNLWSRYCFLGEDKLNKIKAALFYRKYGEFHFLDGKNVMFTFNVASKTEQWTKYNYHYSPQSSSTSDISRPLNYVIREKRFHLKYKRIKEMIYEGKFSISARGTTIPYADGESDGIIQSESIKAEEGSKSRRRLKGVWIQPRYLYVPPGQTW